MDASAANGPSKRGKKSKDKKKRLKKKKSWGRKKKKSLTDKGEGEDIGVKKWICKYDEIEMVWEIVDGSRNRRKEEGSKVGRIQYHFYNSK